MSRRVSLRKRYFPTSPPETPAGVPVCRLEIREKEGGGGSTMRGPMTSSREEQRQRRNEDRSYRSPHTELETSAVGIRSDVRPRYWRWRQERTGPGHSDGPGLEPGGADFRITDPEGRKRRAYEEAGNWYIGTTGEGAKRATLSTCGEGGPGIGSE